MPDRIPDPKLRPTWRSNGGTSRRELLSGLAGMLSSVAVLGAGCAGRRAAPRTSAPGIAVDFRCPPPPQPPTGDGILAQFMGTTSVLFRDADTAILSDGFVTRPSAVEVVRRTPSSEPHVSAALGCLGVRKIAAVFVGHTHHDHALDAPAFALRTEARLLGSKSARGVGRRAHLPEHMIDVISDGATRTFGNFELTFIESRHSTPNLSLAGWKSGKTWSTFIRRGNRTILVHGSANYRSGALRGRRAGVVYLGVGSLGNKPDAFVDAYWDEVVRRTEAKRVFLVHWDDFFDGMEQGLKRMPKHLDLVDDAIRRLEERAKRDNVQVRIPTLWDAVDPFEGL